MLTDKLIKVLGVIKYRVFRNFLGIVEKPLRVVVEVQEVMDYDELDEFLRIILGEKTVNL